MCDLIDLNSPDVKGLPDAAKLASPLIPVPKTTEATGGEANPSASEKRESVGSNPFDRVLHETTEYISKKGDPFEVMFQRALKFKGRKNADPRMQLVDFTDDFTPKRKKRYLKMNKTLDALDESLLRDKLELSCRKLATEVKEDFCSHSARNTDVVCSDNVTENAPILKNNLKIFVTTPDSLELSILNQSAMNDTLLEPASKTKEDNEISPFLESDALFKELHLPPNANVKSIESRCALSQGDMRSPIKLPCLNRRLQSASCDQRRALQSEGSTVSSLNRGFLDSKQSEQSVFSSLSNISSVKPNSISVSSLMSNDTMNDAFLNSNSLKKNVEKTSTAEDSQEVKLKQYELSDLAEKFNKLKCTMNGTNSISSVMDDSNSLKEGNNKQIANDKPIDVDVFVLENSNKEHNKSSVSTDSSDSVFTDTSKLDKSIMNEAKTLARTFEELALKSDSGSSADSDDLISNNTLWMSDLLPAFEDEPVVHNLIELPVSPEKNSKDAIKDDKQHISTSMNNAKENSLKGIVSQFTDCVPTVKQTIVTSLLSDLKKLLKAENNTEVNKLVDDLEIALGAKNNTELLITCLNISNELQSPRKSSSAESSEKTSVDKGKDESGKISSEGEVCNGEKSLSDITHKLENTSQAAVAASDNDVSAQTSPCKDNSRNLNDTNAPKVAVNTSYIEQQNNQLDEKLAVELLMNLRKLLRGQADDAATIQILKNIGKALNIASNICKLENEQRMNCDRKRNIQQTTPVKDVGSDRVAHLANATHRRSFDSKSKRTFEKSGRRSAPVIESPTSNMPGIRHKYTGISEVENRKKRSSSDSEFISLANKKVVIPETAKTKVETTEYDVKKEKPIAIGDVKNRLKKRSSVINKKGPMKALHPVNNVQKRASLGKRAAPSSSTVTPPKSDKVAAFGSKIISSTPNSVDSNHCMLRKPARSNPVASSTPNGQNGKASSAQVTSANKNRNFSCEISPVTTYANPTGNDERKDSPKRSCSKLPTPKKSATPKRQETDVPRTSRYSTPPRHNSSFNVNHQRSLPESPQRLNRSLATSQRYSPVYRRKSNEKVGQSPLKENNRVIAKVKPLKLISKLKRHSNGDFAEKENNCA
ncbi:uncharacterized protein LOC105286669 [Ooceraea biroi]|uniref:uncharacterized protein LOC105286669 n=1 Tax=Ooceraea biroi TaxID=2015173 RepID=UPI000F07FB51|nr:uncharacterized protein LOC105286669 [Ooceraea biroi]